MHVALNAQEAVLIHAWTIIHPLWSAGYPDVENTAPINMRPKRRTAMLALPMTAWQECREEFLKSYKLRIAKNPKATPVRKAMVESILSIFEDHIPLAVDCPYLLTSGDLLQIKMCLKRLFPLFTLLGKKNYLNIVLFQLGLLAKLPSSLPQDLVMAFLFSVFSSEDLEVFHSILRTAIRFQDTNVQVARKAMLITAMRGDSALRQLAAITEREKAIRARSKAPVETEETEVSIKIEPGTADEPRASAPSPLEKAADDVVPRMVAYIKKLFATRFDFSFDVVGQHEKLPYASSAVSHYNLVIRAPSPTTLSQKENPAVNSTSPTDPTVIVATIRESLVPLPLRRQNYVNLGNHVDIENLQSVPMPAENRCPLGDITNEQVPATTKKTKVREFLTTDSLKYDLAPCGCLLFSCQCAAILERIATTSIENLSANIDKNAVRDETTEEEELSL
ncbi:hypothetical protein DFS34DRAFT_303204 [Phlyctochytrium arcticum]|nr:hypothetical protein DFS34DRAFT_303204 [Phlyctochytrium arcticum]